MIEQAMATTRFWTMSAPKQLRLIRISFGLGMTVERFPSFSLPSATLFSTTTKTEAESKAFPPCSLHTRQILHRKQQQHHSNRHHTTTTTAPKIIDVTRRDAAQLTELRRVWADEHGRRGVVLGLDVGTRHVGVAQSDIGGRIAFPLLGFRRYDLTSTSSGKGHNIMQRLHDCNAVAGVIGVPMHQRADGTQVKDMVMYGLYVLHRCGVKTVVLADERYSSVIARQGVSDGDEHPVVHDSVAGDEGDGFVTKGYLSVGSKSTKTWKTEMRDARRRDQTRKKERRKRAKQLNCSIEKHAIDASAAAVILQDVLDTLHADKD